MFALCLSLIFRIYHTKEYPAMLSTNAFYASSKFYRHVNLQKSSNVLNYDLTALRLTVSGMNSIKPLDLFVSIMSYGLKKSFRPQAQNKSRMRRISCIARISYRKSSSPFTRTGFIDQDGQSENGEPARIRFVTFAQGSSHTYRFEKSCPRTYSKHNMSGYVDSSISLRSINSKTNLYSVLVRVAKTLHSSQGILTIYLTLFSSPSKFIGSTTPRNMRC